MKNEEGIPNTFYWTYAGEDGTTKVTMEVEYTVCDRAMRAVLTRPRIGRARSSR